MRKWTLVALNSVIVLVALTALASAQTPATTLPATTLPASPLTVDDIVAKHLATKGGAEHWKSIRTQKTTGVAIAQGFEVTMTIYGKRPNVSRQELLIEVPGQPAVTIVSLFDGTTAWTINPMSGSDVPQEMANTETATAKVQSDFDGALIDYQAKGYTVVLLDPVAVATKPAIHLKVTRADMPTQHVYLDPVTFVELRVATEGVGASETDLSDYRSIEGIMVPHAITISQGGTVQAELKIQTVEFNLPLDDALFRVK